MKTLLIASDHAGVDLKNQILSEKSLFGEWKDLGPFSKDSVDYPDFADAVARLIHQNPEEKAILICGSGQGMAIRANKYPNVRAALGYNEDITKLSRQHNNANILCLGARFLNFDQAQKIIKIFFETPFEGGRHQGRVDKLSKKIVD